MKNTAALLLLFFFGGGGDEMESVLSRCACSLTRRYFCSLMILSNSRFMLRTDLSKGLRDSEDTLPLAQKQLRTVGGGGQRGTSRYNIACGRITEDVQFEFNDLGSPP